MKKKPAQGCSLTKISRLIPAKDGKKATAKVQIIGGDSSNFQDGDIPPTVILEKTKDDRISKIIVKCTCGKHAELVCESEPIHEKNQNSKTGEEDDYEELDT